MKGRKHLLSSHQGVRLDEHPCIVELQGRIFRMALERVLIRPVCAIEIMKPVERLREQARGVAVRRIAGKLRAQDIDGRDELPGIPQTLRLSDGSA